MERYLQIGKSNIVHNLLIQLLSAFIFLLLSPLLMEIQYLDAGRTAKILEMYVALLGVIFLTPVFLPEQNDNIKELIASKYTPEIVTILIRILEAAICLIAMLGIYVLILRQNHCDFAVKNFFLGTVAEAVFLGGMGLFAYSLFNQIAIAYMLPLVYYMINMGSAKKYVGNFYLFSMSYGSYHEKIYLAAGGMILILCGICYPYIKNRLFPRLFPHRIIH